MKTITLSANSSWYLYNFRSSTIIEAINRGYEVTCLSPTDDYTQSLVSLGCKHYPINFISKNSNPFSEFLLIFKFFFAYQKIKPMIAFHFTVKNNIYGTIAAASMGIPAVSNISGLGTAFIKTSLISNVVLFLYKVSQRFAFKIFCQNEEDLNFLINNKISSKGKLILIPGSGVDTNRFHPNLRENYHSSISNNNKFTFLYAGRMLYDKGLNELLEAFQALNKHESISELVLCGFVDSDNISAISNHELQSWSKISGVEWVGSSNNIEIIMAKADCIVLPSYREGMPKTLLEAGSMGLPAIATNVPGCRNIITDNFNGILCEPYSSTSLKHAMEKIIRLDKNKLSTMGNNARSRVLEKFDETIVIKNFFQVIDQL